MASPPSCSHVLVLFIIGLVFVMFSCPTTTARVRKTKLEPVEDCPRFDYEYKIIERLIMVELELKKQTGITDAKELRAKIDKLAQELAESRSDLETLISELREDLLRQAEEASTERRLFQGKLIELQNCLEEAKSDIEMIKQNATGRVYIIRIEVLSGRENPETILDETHPAFSDISADLEDLQSTPLAEGLGYRGFTVKIHTRVGWFEKTIGRLTFSSLESKLLGFFDLLVYELREHIEGVLQSQYDTTTMPPHIRTTAVTKDYYFLYSSTPQLKTINDIISHSTTVTTDRPPPTSTTPEWKLPLYNPAKWNAPTAQPFNNCYNYANDKITNTFAQPGRGSGAKFQQMTGAEVQAAAVRDGLSVKTQPTVDDECLVALVIWKNVDYHWYRMDSNRLWSHKPGGTPAKDTDNTGAKIQDPKTANRGPYTEFITYMGTDNSVTIQ